MRFAKGIDFKHCPKMEWRFLLPGTLEAPQGPYQDAIGSRQEDDLSFQGGGHPVARLSVPPWQWQTRFDISFDIATNWACGRHRRLKLGRLESSILTLWLD